MTRTSRLAGIGLMALSVIALDARSDDKAASNPVEGAWRQVEKKNGAAQEYQKLPEGVEMIDCLVGGRFIWTITKDGKVLGVAGGRYKSEGGKQIETIDYIAGQGIPESFVGSPFEFTMEVNGNSLHKVGTVQVNGKDYKIDEKWERCK